MLCQNTFLKNATGLKKQKKFQLSHNLTFSAGKINLNIVLTKLIKQLKRDKFKQLKILHQLKHQRLNNQQM